MSAQAPCTHGLTHGDGRAPFGKAALQVSPPHASLLAVGQLLTNLGLLPALPPSHLHPAADPSLACSDWVSLCHPYACLSPAASEGATLALSLWVTKTLFLMKVTADMPAFHPSFAFAWTPFCFVIPASQVLRILACVLGVGWHHCLLGASLVGRCGHASWAWGSAHFSECPSSCCNRHTCCLLWLCHSHCKGLWENYLITSNLTSTSSLYTVGNQEQDLSQSVFHKDQKDWCLWFCYRLNVCAPTKSMLNPNPQCDDIKRWSLWEGIKSWRWSCHEWN